MTLLRFEIKGASLFADNALAVDLFATDRVVKQKDSGYVEDVFRIGELGSIYSLNIVGFSGVNASGKTTVLNLLRFVLGKLTGSYLMRRFQTPYDRLGKLEDRLEISAVFAHEGSFYLIESELMRDRRQEVSFGSDFRNDPNSYVFIDETLWQFSSKRIKREMISNFELFKQHSRVLLRRNGIKGEVESLSEDARALLNDRSSRASFVTNKVSILVEEPDRSLPAITMPTEVIQAFDGSVEKLDWDSDAQVFHLKFKGEDERIVGMEAAVAMLSRGTVYGSELVDHAIDVLRRGGYLIIDEIEESLNRALVTVVLDLFSSPITNPQGAQLIFSTHYPELLDAVNRKDAINILVRDEQFKTNVVKYSDRISRIENKKSEVILSNAIKGSMPRYPDVQAMREFVRRCVNDRCDY